MRKASLILFALLVVSLGSCAEKPTQFEGISGSLRVTGKLPGEKVGAGPCTVSVSIESPAGVMERGVILSHRVARSKTDFRGPYKSILFEPEGGSGRYQALIPDMPKGTIVFYYVTVRDSAGNKVTLPAEMAAGEKPRAMRFKGEISEPLLAAHVGFMFLGLFLILLSMISAVAHLARGKATKPMFLSTVLATAAIFVGGFPLGWAVSYVRLGKPWEGIPLGWDITDSKTLIIFVFYLIVVLLKRNALFGRSGRDAVSDRTFAVLALIAGITASVIYLIPHSI